MRRLPINEVLGDLHSAAATTAHTATAHSTATHTTTAHSATHGDLLKSLTRFALIELVTTISNNEAQPSVSACWDAHMLTEGDTAVKQGERFAHETTTRYEAVNPRNELLDKVSARVPDALEVA